MHKKKQPEKIVNANRPQVAEKTKEEDADSFPVADTAADPAAGEDHHITSIRSEMGKVQENAFKLDSMLAKKPSIN